MKMTIKVSLIVLFFLAYCTGCGTMDFLGGKSERGAHEYHAHSDDVSIIDSGLVWFFGP